MIEPAGDLDLVGGPPPESGGPIEPSTVLRLVGDVGTPEAAPPTPAAPSGPHMAHLPHGSSDAMVAARGSAEPYADSHVLVDHHAEDRHTVPSGTVKITANVPGATAILGGIAMELPAEAPIAAGRYALEVHADGFRAKRGVVTIEDGQLTIADVQLVPLGVATPQSSAMSTPTTSGLVTSSSRRPAIASGHKVMLGVAAAAIAIGAAAWWWSSREAAEAGATGKAQPTKPKREPRA